MKISGEEAGKLSQEYREQMLEIMEEWAEHTQDPEREGYDTDFGENWRLQSHMKNIWAQARQAYMFGAVYQTADRNDKWLSIAKRGRDFLRKYAYAGGGRWNYQLSEDGKQVVKGPCSVFTDLFVLMALSQYAAASGDFTDLWLIRETFFHIREAIPDPEFKELMPHVWQKGILRHSPYMIAINAASVAGQALGRETVKPFLEECIEKELHFFAENESGWLLESLREDGSIWDTPEGRQVNPGHILEGMAFCIDEFLYDGNRKEELAGAVSTIRKTAEISLDREYGGIAGSLDYRILGTPEYKRYKEGDKVDWVNCEGLYALALGAVFTEDDQAAGDFRLQHNFCQRFFRPSQGGDWYPLVSRRGKTIRANKGGKHRAAFHVPRALLRLSLLFDAVSRQETGKNQRGFLKSI